MTKRSKTLVRDHSIIGGVMLIATLAILVFRPVLQPPLEIGLPMAGLNAGALLLRFGVPRMVHLVRLAFTVITLMLGSYHFIGWFGGFGDGANLGVAWRALAAREKATYP